MERLAGRFWNRQEWDEALSLDNVFRHVEAGDLQDGARAILQDLDDLGVLLMFSVFEAVVRDRAWADIKDSLPGPLHPAVSHAVEDLKKDIESGSFGRVTEAFKSLDHDLIEKVNQVRRYRNWVAHGRRGEQRNFVTPEQALERLTEFLNKMSEVAAVPGENPGTS